eukprot:scaffold331122_cov33-Prasinocladus_malaysianus.AAC.1
MARLKLQCESSNLLDSYDDNDFILGWIDYLLGSSHHTTLLILTTDNHLRGLIGLHTCPLRIYCIRSISAYMSQRHVRLIDESDSGGQRLVILLPADGCPADGSFIINLITFA